MGAWGEEPYANDTAGEWLDDTMFKTKIAKRIERALKGKYEEKQRAAAYLLERIGQASIYPHEQLAWHLTMASVRMQQLLDNKEWIGSWRNPRAVRTSLRRQIKNLEANYPSKPEVKIGVMKKIVRQQFGVK